MITICRPIERALLLFSLLLLAGALLWTTLERPTGRPLAASPEQTLLTVHPE